MADLPPLNALRAFEVAARTGSFVQAGAELGVTAAAVSQQVKGLETHLGRRLFQRQGNRIVLTDAGRALYPRLEVAFADLTAAVSELSEAQVRPRLVVSVLPVLADHWLIPRLAGFDREIGIEIRVEEDPVVLSRDGVDLRLTYGAHFYPDHRIEVLFRDQVIAVAAPGVVGGALGELPDTAFIHTDWGPAYGSQPTWATWGLGRAPDPVRGLRVGLSSLALAAARAGIGVALVPARIAEADLTAGRVVRVGSHGVPLRWDFVLVHSNAIQRRRSLQALVAYLLG